jgi:hypothetical protein
MDYEWLEMLIGERLDDQGYDHIDPEEVTIHLDAISVERFVTGLLAEVDSAIVAAVNDADDDADDDSLWE